MARCIVSLVMLAAIATMGLSFSGDLENTTDCNSCRENETLSTNVDLAQVPLSCCELANTSSKSGVYLVSGAEGSKFARKLVSCDTTGGWTVVQRRFNGLVQFNKSWDEYENGFGDLSGEFWYGLKGLHVMTSQGDWEIRVEAEGKNRVVWYVQYGLAKILGAEEQYRLEIYEPSSNVDYPFLNNFNGSKFSTYDQDNDMTGTLNCAAIEPYQGGWWYSENCRGDKSLNINKIFKRGTLEWKGTTIMPVRTEMKIRPKNCLSRRTA